MKGLIDVSRSGYIWDLERTADKINFVAGRPYVRQNVFKSLDPKTGRPDIDEARKAGTGAEASRRFASSSTTAVWTSRRFRAHAQWD